LAIVLDPPATTTDAVLVGAGIMSATLSALLRLLEPDWSITLIERLDGAACESSDPWNNAGTGHSALCELNYTPQRPDGSIDITKAVNVNEEFQISRQFWAYAAENGVLTDVRGFLNPIPHASWVQRRDQVDFMRRRREALVGNPLFESIELIEDPDEFARRLPLMSAGRNFSEPIALNWAPYGTDVDFGALTKQLIGYGVRNGTEALFGHEVRDLARQRDGTWTVKMRNNRTGATTKIHAKFVFVGAGGAALRLMQRSGIPEIKGFGGFPVSGKFLRSDNPELAARHRAKVYGFPAAGAPPMSAPHLDARLINGKTWLLFGPFAGWSPKFLKQGHVTDLPMSVKPNNLGELLSVGVSERALVSYLLGQLTLSDDDRIDALREFAPSATSSDWETIVAGQRVQVIRPEKDKGGVLGFDTTAVISADGSIAGLLGASPGASTSVHDVLDVMERTFGSRYESWLPRLKEMVPSLGVKLSDEPRLFHELWDWTTRALGLS
jgi:malate dehydrogenase (quinone)